MNIDLSSATLSRKITNFSGRVFGILRISLLLFFLFALLVRVGAQQKASNKIKLPEELREVSGLYIESPDRFWWHNDSSNPPILFQTDAQGNIREEICLDTWKNKDWEDITADDSGNIYIGDFGNNCNCRTDLRIYIYNQETEALATIEFTLEDQTLFPPDKKDQRFDLEAFFWHDGTLHLFSKNTLHGGDWVSTHYVLSESPGTQVAQVYESIVLPKRVVTGAAISADGKTVALVAYRFKMLLGFIPFSQASVFVFSEFEGSNYFQGNMKKKAIPPFFIATQYESIDFLDAQTVYVASERTLFIRPRAKKMKILP